MKTLTALIVLLAITSQTYAQDGRARFLALEEKVKALEAEKDALRRKLALAQLKISSLESKLEKAEFLVASKTNKSTAETQEALTNSGEYEAKVQVISNDDPDLSSYDAKIRAQTTTYSQARSSLTSAESRYNKMRQDNASRYKFRDEPHSETDLAKMRTLIKKQRYLAEGASAILKRYQRERERAAAIRIVGVKNLDDNSVLQLQARGGLLLTAKGMGVGQQYVIQGRLLSNGIVVLTKVSAAN